MRRLRHSIKAQIATLRLTTRTLIVFFEGKDLDPFYYGQIVTRFADSLDLAVGMKRAEELPNNADANRGGAGGKKALLKAAAFWERYRAKYLHNWSTKKSIAFCVDKDSDDYTGLPHFLPTVVRTPMFCVENHLFASADLVAACEIALSLAPGEMTLFKDGPAWRQAACSRWEDWITFCLLCTRLEAKRVPNYSSTSLFNSPANATADQNAIASHYSRLQVASGFSHNEFLDLRKITEEFCKTELSSGRQDRLFKGKWYIDVLYADLLNSQWNRRTKQLGKDALLVALRSRCIVTHADYAYYEPFFTKILAL